MLILFCVAFAGLVAGATEVAPFVGKSPVAGNEEDWAFRWRKARFHADEELRGGISDAVEGCQADLAGVTGGLDAQLTEEDASLIRRQWWRVNRDSGWTAPDPVIFGVSFFDPWPDSVFAGFARYSTFLEAPRATIIVPDIDALPSLSGGHFNELWAL